MKRPLFRLLLAALLLHGTVQAQSTPDTSYSATTGPNDTSYDQPKLIGVYISIPDTSILTSVSPTGAPTFSITGINTIIANHSISYFDQAFPTSKYEYLRHVYYAACSTGDSLGQELYNAYPDYFPYYENRYLGMLLTSPPYTPVDLASHWPCNSDHLIFLDAPDAWGVTQGDPTVVIGITDTHVDAGNPDLIGKIATLGSNSNYPSTGSAISHGTMVTGLACANTDNSDVSGPIGVASAGFNCTAEFDDSYGDDNTMLVMAQGGDQVLNGSWTYDNSPTLDLASHFTAQGIYNEIYENGTLACFAAGNGAPQGGPDNFVYPSAYDHVFSTTGEGWVFPNDGINTWNVQGMHNYDLTAPASGTQQHNSTVDIMAPSIQVSGLSYNPSDPTEHYSWGGGWGTSFASPVTAGTAGLIKSVNSAFTPYQIEYILKTTARSSYLSLTENLPFAGKLGAGGLDMGLALQVIDPSSAPPTGFDHITPNSPDIQTMTIDGIEINTICAPGYSSNGAAPQFSPIISNGTAPYTYVWEAVPGNTTTLDAYDIEEPTVQTSTGANIAYYRLTVYDASTVQKVANRIIKVTLTTANEYDLAMRDAYTDMLDEPNNMYTVNASDWDIWHSPDVWNRQLQDGGTDPENPDYSSSTPNYAYVRVRNVGCASSPSDATVRLYWTKASTGEYWQDNWDGTTQVTAASGYGTSGLVPAGAEITSGSPLSIGVLDPGESIILNHSWYPPNPLSFAGSPTDVDACFLARIIDNHGFTISELLNQTVKYNVNNNNNIVTRNFIVTNLSNSHRTSSHQVDVANAEGRTQVFNLELIDAKTLDPYLSGDFAAVAYAQVYLGTVYDKWVAGGRHGHVLRADSATKSVIFDQGQRMELDNISLSAHERIPVTVVFKLKSGVHPGNNNFLIHMRQFLAGHRTSDNVYGNVDFKIITTGCEDSATERRAATTATTDAPTTTFNVFPSPAADKINVSNISQSDIKASITITNSLGQVVLSRPQQTYSVGAPTTFSVTGFAAGTYFVNIKDAAGKTNHFTFLKD